LSYKNIGTSYGPQYTAVIYWYVLWSAIYGNCLLRGPIRFFARVTVEKKSSIPDANVPPFFVVSFSTDTMVT
jgi:hypothetical protein